MKCCIRCFQDAKLLAFINSDGAIDDCDYCGAKMVKTISVEDLGTMFIPLLELYEPVGAMGFNDEKSLAECIASWRVFSENLPMPKQNQILDALRTVAKDLEKLPSGSNQWQSIVADELTWLRFADHIKQKRRFILSSKDVPFLSEPKEWLPDLLKDTDMLVSLDNVFYRAREGCKDRENAFPAEQMGSPPPEKSRRGRANPAGISYLYVAEEEETSVAEIRPFVGASVSICKLAARKKLKVADISNIHIIESAFLQADLEKRVRRNAVLNILNQELARPVNPEDSEVEYVPTQYLAEVILDLGYDGIRYQSAVRQGGKNYVFFNPADLVIAPETKLVRVESIDVKFS